MSFPTRRQERRKAGKGDGEECITCERERGKEQVMVEKSVVVVFGFLYYFSSRVVYLVHLTNKLDIYMEI